MRESENETEKESERKRERIKERHTVCVCVHASVCWRGKEAQRAREAHITDGVREKVAERERQSMQ